MPRYDGCPGAIWICTTPPAAREMRPECAAAVQMLESSEYTSVPHTVDGAPPAGHAKVSTTPGWAR